MTKKLYPEESVQAVADAIRSKKNVQLNPVGKLTIGAMADAIKRIRLGCPINVSVHMQDGKWIRPDGWTDLDALTCGEDELYMTFDASERIDDPHCSFTLYGADYSVEINGQKWSKNADESFTYAFVKTDGTYPLVHVKAEGHITAFYFDYYTIDGRTYDSRLNPLVERVGDVYDYGQSNRWNTIYLEREKVVRHACASNATGLSDTWCYCYSLQSLDLSGWDTTNWAVTSLPRTFFSTISLKSLDISCIDMGKVKNWGSNDYQNISGVNLVNFKCGENNYGKFAPTTYVYLYFSNSQMLTRESLVEFGKMLGTVTSKHYLVMGSVLSNKITAAEKEEITAKGWTIS